MSDILLELAAQVRDSVAVHVPCSSKKMGLADAFTQVASLCAHEVTHTGIPCCGEFSLLSVSFFLDLHNLIVLISAERLFTSVSIYQSSIDGILQCTNSRLWWHGALQVWQVTAACGTQS